MNLTLNSNLEVLSISTLKPKSESLLAFAIDSPRIGHKLNGEFRISGWVLGKISPAVAIEVIGRDNLMVEKIPVNLTRPDVAKVYPKIPEASKSGFAKSVKVKNILSNSELRLQTILKNKQQIPLGTIRLQQPKEQKPLGRDRHEMRLAIAHQYLKGDGIEIGALHSPLAVPKSVKVKYVDRMSVANLRKQYPELRNKKLVEVDIIDDGESLGNIADSTQDFVIANHFIEHCQNPISAIENMLRVLKTDGILYLAIPDKRFTFDKDRPTTSIDHLLKDYREGPAWSRRQHFEEWVKFVSKIRDRAKAEHHLNHLMDIDYSIHYHAWTPKEILELLITLQSVLKFKFEVKLFTQNISEMIVVLEK